MPRGSRRRNRRRVGRPQRPNSTRRGYGYRWEQYAKRFRSESEHALCAMCLQAGRTTASECVDHIVPVTGPDDPRFWDRSNHWALCWSCHSRKTNTTDKGRGRRARGG